ncbi:RNA-binding protein S4 [bacterium DOLZORAL124_38_8]|nr:MAG: RNA-binding protein S4 [bacterium DOLZORAL124_38_8]
MRLDKWIWAVRLVKTRTQATNACKLGQVSVNGQITTKAAKIIKVGDRITVKYQKQAKDYEVVGFINKQTSADKVAQYFIDHTEYETPEIFSAAPQKERIEKKHYRKDQGRPVKKDRRRMDDFFESF